LHEDDDAETLTLLGQSWSQFIAEGGVSYFDLLKFMRGEPLGGKARVRRHLRLLSNTNKPITRITSINGGDAA
jgi:hypothetical protein